MGGIVLENGNPINRITSVQLKRVLVSVTDRTGLVDFASALSMLDIQIMSTKGTAKFLQDNKVKAEALEFPELLGGRVKTLREELFAGVLAQRDNQDHMKSVKPIDLVVVNFYNVQNEDSIDIGGPALVRAAAKNHKYVTVIVDPNDYKIVLDELMKNNCIVGDQLRLKLAKKAFEKTKDYDDHVLQTLFGGLDTTSVINNDSFPDVLDLKCDKVMDMRYGENPHQKSALYKFPSGDSSSVVNSTIVSVGKELSYNNIMDMDAAFELVREFEKPACVIVKHTNPCGAAMAEDADTAFQRALDCDPRSAFGGIIAFNAPINQQVAYSITDDGNFFEAIIAPTFEEGSADILTDRQRWGKKLRLLRSGDPKKIMPSYYIRSVKDGILVQDEDTKLFERFEPVVGTISSALEDELKFAWKVAKHAKSNAIVVSKQFQAVGVGAGQVSRVDACHIAVQKAGERARGGVAASDAFFPFKDALKILLDAGVIGVVQPGGSIRDREVIDLAKEYDIPLVITGTRHFRH